MRGARAKVGCARSRSLPSALPSQASYFELPSAGHIISISMNGLFGIGPVARLYGLPPWGLMRSGWLTQGGAHCLALPWLITGLWPSVEGGMQPSLFPCPRPVQGYLSSRGGQTIARRPFAAAGRKVRTPQGDMPCRTRGRPLGPSRGRRKVSQKINRRPPPRAEVGKGEKAG